MLEEEEKLELPDEDELEPESEGSQARELLLEELEELDEEEEELLLDEELELLLALGSNSNESSPPPAELLDEFPSSTSWYRLTSVSTVSPSLSAGAVCADR